MSIANCYNFWTELNTVVKFIQDVAKCLCKDSQNCIFIVHQHCRRSKSVNLSRGGTGLKRLNYHQAINATWQPMHSSVLCQTIWYNFHWGYPQQWWQIQDGWEKYAIFDQYRALLEMVYNINSDYRRLIGSRMRSIERYHFQWPWVTPIYHKPFWVTINTRFGTSVDHGESKPICDKPPPNGHGQIIWLILGHDQFLGHIAVLSTSMRPIVTDRVARSVTVVSPAKTTKPIKTAFGLWTWVGPRNHVLDGGPNHPMRRGNFRVKYQPSVKYRDAVPWAVQKRLNQSIRHLRCRVWWTQATT